MSDDDRLARVALSRLTEPGDPKIASLVAQLGAVTLRELLSDPTQVSPEARDVASRLRGVDPAADLEAGEKAGLRYVVPGDDEWPSQVDDLMRAELLDHRGGPPLGLWVKGPTRLDQLGRAVAVVGARSATTYGTEVAAGIAGALVRAGHPVVSGAAFGIDQAAHRGALSVEGANVAVLACGADRAYPTAHHDLLDHLGRTSAVVAEVPPGCAPTRGRFLSRNRLIAALTRGTVVVEAAARSGALNTAGWATRLNRHLMGVPGPVTSAQSQGVHQLIRSGAASLVTYGDEVLEIVGESGTHLVTQPRGPSRPRDRVTPRDARVLDAVPLASPAPVDSIATTAGMALLDVQAALRRLVRDGLVELSERGWRLTPAANE
ncbi:MAG TPA: DNA-processing protein DprA [Nocardioides sp.]|nr:DNA-processing protein DprA [Nocardioides sp.]